MSDNKEILPDINNIKSSETYTLPSKGLIYDKSLNIPASITLRRMTTKEDKIRLRNTSENNIKKEILQACILEQGIDAGKLSVIDANFLYFKLRVLSLLDDTYKIRCICPYCKTEFIHQINLSEVPVTYLSKDKLSLMKIELPLSKQKIDFKLPNLDAITKSGEDYEEYITKFPDADKIDYLYTSGRAMYIDKVNNHKLMSIEVTEWLDNLDIIDSRAVTDIINQLQEMYGYIEDIVGKCPNPECGKSVPHGLPITSELFSPSK